MIGLVSVSFALLLTIICARLELNAKINGLRRDNKILYDQGVELERQLRLIKRHLGIMITEIPKQLVVEADPRPKVALPFNSLGQHLDPEDK